MFGIDRKKMEEERLARLAAKKRPRSISPPAVDRSEETHPHKLLKLDNGVDSKVDATPSSTQESVGSLRKPFQFTSLANVSALPTPPSTQESSASRPTSKASTDEQSSNFRKTLQLQDKVSPPPTSVKNGAPLQFVGGAIKRTWAFGHDRSNDLKIEEVLQKHKLRLAVLSSFQWHTDWVFSKLRMKEDPTRVVFIMQAKGEALKIQMLDEIKDIPNLRICFPNMEGQVNCMHSKLMLLSFEECLRVVVPSANLTNYDWGETGIMENSMFVIDLPRLDGGRLTKEEDLTFFGKELLYFIRTQGLDPEICRSLLKFDFAMTANIAFVHTTGGAFLGSSMKRTGLPGLSQAVQRLGLKADEIIEIDFAASSIGSLNDAQLKSFYAAAYGSAAATVPGPIQEAYERPLARALQRIHEHIRIYFPTHDTVAASTGGVNNGGTICLASQHWRGDPFPNDVFRDYKSTRAGLLSHNKILLVRSRTKAWVYVGSANMSESAWGKVVKDKDTKQPKINCRNWETGVLIPVPVVEVEGRAAAIVDFDVFKGVIDIPWQMPGEKYSGRHPWFFRG